LKLLVVSGLSGSGKSSALDMLEDLGFYCVDNIPATVVGTLVEQLADLEDNKFDRVAIGLDTRPKPEDIDEVVRLIREFRQRGDTCEVLYLQANTQVLLKRYSETRRRHPLSSHGMGLGEAIDFERQLLAPVCDLADLTIDTTRMSIHDLRRAIRDRLDDRNADRLSILFRSFGFKHGLPGDADFVFDARTLPNPYWETSLRSLSGRDAPVIEYLEGHDDVARYVDDVAGFLERWLPEFRKANRSYLTIAIGCTGGQHRSVYVAERLGRHFRNAEHRVLVRHSELPPDS
jgi:UPF0042 nucleotide-binding protein